MNPRNLGKLIPRNNWDYGLEALFFALSSINNKNTQKSNIENIFHQKPIWTRSGRASLYAILKSLDLPIGARVGVPLFCCPVVFNAIHQAGLSPRFIDSNLHDFNISVDDLRKKREDLAAIVAVHTLGNPCDMDAINTVADTIPVIEDCAQSIFSTYKGKTTGFLATASFFSFRSGKYISAGEGSAIFCRDHDIQNKIERIVNSFKSWSPLDMFTSSLINYFKAALYSRPWYGLIGYPVGMRLDRKFNLTAKDGFDTGKIASTHLALIDQRITRIQERINIQKEHARILLEEVVPGNFSLPFEGDGCSSNWFQFALKFQNANQRDLMAGYLFNRGIDTAKYLDIIVDEARIDYAYEGDCPNAELLSKTVLLVPIHYSLCVSDMEYIACSINGISQII
jgi:perosamine synthetase